MADITMCEGKACPLKDNCYRHTATADKWRQSYFTIVPYNPVGHPKCEYFWDNKGRK